MAIKRDRPRVPPSFQSFGALFVCMVAVLERCGLLPEVALASLLAFIAVVLMTNEHMNTVRCHVLSDQTSTWRLASVCHGFSTLNAVSMLRLRNRGPRERHDAALLTATERLKCTARELGGQVNYVGRAVHVAVKSKQLSDADEFDVVVLSSWSEAGTAGWTSFRQIVDSEHGWERHVACGYWRNPMGHFAIVVALVLLRLKCGLRGVHHNIALTVAPAKACDRQENGDDIALRAQMDRLSAKVDALGMPKAGVLICNYLNSELRAGGVSVEMEDRARDRGYVQLMMEMLAQHGGGPIHLGRVASLASTETGAFNDGEWRQCACVYYPGCAFFSQLMRSEWMWRVVKDKRPGDSLAVVTVPFRSAKTEAETTTPAVANASTSSSESGPELSTPHDTGLRRRKSASARPVASSRDSLTAGGTDAEPKLVSVPFLAMCQLVGALWLFRRYM